MKNALLAAAMVAVAAAVPALPASAQTPFQEQVACNKQAEKVYAKTSSEVVNRDAVANIESHFSSKLNVCLALVRLDWGALKTVYTLQDAFGGHVFGQFYLNNPNEYPWGVKPTACYVGTTMCSSEEEWEALAEKYMTN